jgi:hypothetical protein
MGQSYTRTFNVVTEGAATVALNFPGRSYLSSIIVSQAAGGEYNATAYNRAFTSAAVAVSRVSEGDGGKTLFTLAGELRLKAGDTITVSGVHTDYNGTRQIQRVINPSQFVTTQDHTVDVNTTAGTVALAIPTYMQAIYVLFPQTAASSGVATLTANPRVPFHNQDALTDTGTTAEKLYLTLSAAGTYAISVNAELNIDS